MTTEQAMREALDGHFYGVDHFGTYYCKNARRSLGKSDF